MSNRSPRLEDVSKRDSFIERRQVHRVSLTGEQFQLESTGKVFSVVDLSIRGMGIRVIDPVDLAAFEVGSVIRGRINLKRTKYVLSSTVRNIRSDIVGCEFAEVSPELIDALGQLSDPKILGKQMKPAPSSDPATIWYRGVGTELMIQRAADGSYRQLMLVFLGDFAHWDEKSLSTGKYCGVDSAEIESGPFVRETLSLETDPQPDSNKLKVAESLLSHTQLPEELKRWCLRCLRTA